MSKDLMRRIEKLERPLGGAACETKLRRLVRRWGGNEQAYLRAVRGPERELGPALGEDGTIPWGRLPAAPPVAAAIAPCGTRKIWRTGAVAQAGSPLAANLLRPSSTCETQGGEKEMMNAPRDRRENPTTEDGGTDGLCP
jgi:hypothetical protein